MTKVMFHVSILISEFALSVNLKRRELTHSCAFVAHSHVPTRWLCHEEHVQQHASLALPNNPQVN